MSAEKSDNVKVAVGVMFSAKELEFEVGGKAADLQESIQAQIDGGAKVLTFDDGEGKRVVVPVDKLCYVELTDASKSKPIGFGA
jgi:hypothetical protein